MSDTYPRLGYPEMIPSTIPNLWDGGWKQEAALKTYLELLAPALGITLVENLDATKDPQVSRADYLVRYGTPKEPHVLEAKLDLRLFLQSIGPAGADLYRGIRTDKEAYEAHNLSWPSIVVAGTDTKGDRAKLEDEYPGVVIVVDEDIPDGFPTFTQFQQSLIRAFEHYTR
ncbi:hypothetical protein [Halomontanus rarus]|uniref:hypothetical protein n=1 Tax=Halomontanus rarus TaxID=3034020 RepID=UPI001A992584